MDWVVLCITRPGPRGWPHIIILIIILAVAWLASPDKAFPLALAGCAASLAGQPETARDSQVSLPGDA